jgi:hypothetical protein
MARLTGCGYWLRHKYCHTLSNDLSTIADVYLDRKRASVEKLALATRWSTCFWGASWGGWGARLPKRKRATQYEPLQAAPPGLRRNVPGVGARDGIWRGRSS